ncbi:hypothetical protein ACK32R_04865 [Aeromonas dhakensis]|jgi:hypothetical protein|uniref:hypothetical protein n=1 Tax=Aeromonas dhakensis TaxID=196024 RepID=UPI00398895AD
MKTTDIYDENGDIKGTPSTSLIMAIVGAAAFIFGILANGSFEYYSISPGAIDFFRNEWPFMLPVPIISLVIAKINQRFGLLLAARFFGMIFYLAVFFNILVVFFHVTHGVPKKDNYLDWAFFGGCLFIGGISGLMVKLTFPVPVEEKSTDGNSDVGGA